MKLHEYAVTESILEIIESEAGKASAERVESVTVVIGELSTFVDGSIEFYFTELSKGTIAEGAELIFQRIEAKASCSECGKEFRPTRAYISCPSCCSPIFELHQGQELYIDSMETV